MADKRRLHVGSASSTQRATGNESIDMNTLDIDDLVGNIIDDTEDLGIDDDYIPSKDSDDDDKPTTHKESGIEMADMNEPEEDFLAGKIDDNRSNNNSNKQYKPPKKHTVPLHAEREALSDYGSNRLDVESPPIRDGGGALADSMDLGQFTLRDIDPFGEDEEKKQSNVNPYDMYQDKEERDKKPDADLSKHQNLLDELVMTLLHPDYYKEERLHVRREQLTQHNVIIQGWNSAQIDREIVLVADAMSKIESIAMYDQDWHTNSKIKKDDEKAREGYMMKEVEDLSLLRMMPSDYFGKEKEMMLLESGGDPDDFGGGGKSGNGLDYLRSSTATNTTSDMAQKMFRGMGKDKGNVIVCGACGVKLKMKAKKRHKYHYMGFKCKRTNREWVFHDYLCVKLRKIKEAIKNYVFEAEKEENPNVEEENALIKIETSPSQKQNTRCKPKRGFTTPRKGDHNYNLDGDGNVSEREDSTSSASRMRESIEYSMTQHSEFTDDEDDRDRYRSAKRNSNDSDDEESNKKKKKEKSQREKNFKKLGYITADDIEIPKHLHFRRYRSHIRRIRARLNAEKKHKNAITYKDRFGDLPEILLYCDLNEFGVAIFEFVSDSLKSKMRKSLWNVLEWLALEMPTNEILTLLKKHTHLLSKHELQNYDRVCKATMEGSKFPIACTLRLSAFMYERAEFDLSNGPDFKEKGKQYVNVSRKLLKEIESDHLFALLLMIPTDIGHRNVIEIALQYDLTHFLEDPRIVRVFSVIWFNGYDFLDPDSEFAEPNISVDTVFDKLWKEPGRFFFSPFGKFVISSSLYLGYLALFSYVTYQRIYDYKEISGFPLEIVLWISSGGYVVYEVLEFIDSPKEYFSSMTNYWDILIAINWIILAIIRFTPPKLIYGDDGTLDETAQRNEITTEIYMAVWSLQCVILWTRVASLFKISKRAGPLIRVIINMLDQVGNFFVIWMLFYIGGSFAAYYIIGDDLEESVGLGPLSSVMAYIFKTLIGQPEWEKSVSQINDTDPNNKFEVFDVTRSNMLQSLLFFYSIFGTILLLNLLIAMMASSYEAVKDQSLQELNKQKIDTIYDLDRSRAIITPPFNVAAYFFYAYWYAFEIVAWALTFGHRQFNEEFFSPINRGKTQYSVGDRIEYRRKNVDSKSEFGTCTKKTPKSLRKTKKKKYGRASMINPYMMHDDFERDLEVIGQTDIVQDLEDSQILKVIKPLFKRRTLRIPSLNIENQYCRYCRYNLVNDSMSIEYYLSLFERKGQHIDPDDKQYMKELLATKDDSDIPSPMTCALCPNCYRPFKMTPKGPDVINRMMFILEIVSYGVFYFTLRWIIICVICVPAGIVKIIKWVFKRFARTISGKSDRRATKSIMNTSEENDNYRDKVRQVSKQEEKIDEVVKRIDGSVNRLQKQLLGELHEDENDEFKNVDAAIHNLRSDEFDQEIQKMKDELNEKFKKITQLLNSSGYDD